jgi:hypothetical protein
MYWRRTFCFLLCVSLFERPLQPKKKSQSSPGCSLNVIFPNMPWQYSQKTAYAPRRRAVIASNTPEHLSAFIRAVPIRFRRYLRVVQSCPCANWKLQYQSARLQASSWQRHGVLPNIYFPNKLALCAVMSFVGDLRVTVRMRMECVVFSCLSLAQDMHTLSCTAL